jgi:hypothetical protein
MILGYPILGWLALPVIIGLLCHIGLSRLVRVRYAIRSGSIRSGAVGVTVFRRTENLRYWRLVGWNIALITVCMCVVIVTLSELVAWLLGVKGVKP